MLKKDNKLTILFDNNVTFEDLSNDMLDYARNSSTIDLNSSDDYLYIGYYKPINSVYCEISTANTNANTFTAEFYNGSSWVAIAGFYDETKGFTRSGFIRWDRNQTNEESVEVNSTTKYYIRLRPSATHSSTVIDGINLVFSDDQDLETEVKEVTGTRFLPSGENSHILTHVASRNEIIQKIRNDGRVKRNLSTGVFKKMDAFDLLDIEEIRQASTYLTLSKIYMALSDDPEDIYMDKSKNYRSLYNGAIDLYFLELDFDDDGEKDTSEEQHPHTTRLLRR